MSHPVFLQPIEPIFLGPPRSINAGESHRAFSQFPMSPRTFQGIVRSQLLRGVQPPLDLKAKTQTARQEREKLVGNGRTPPIDWQFVAPLPALQQPDHNGDWRTFPWAPLPRFVEIAAEKTMCGPELFVDTHPSMDDRNTELPDPGSTRYSPRYELHGDSRVSQGWVPAQTLATILSTPFPWSGELEFKRYAPPFVRKQSQPGIALNREDIALNREDNSQTSNTADRRATAADGMLYHYQYLRFEEHSGFYGELQATLDNPLQLASLQHSVAHTGRKSRLIALQQCAPLTEDWQKLLSGSHLQKIDSNCSVWLYFLSPTAKIDNSVAKIPGADLLRLPEGWPTGVTLKTIASFHGTPQIIGGWDMASGPLQWRKNQSYIPAGSCDLVTINAANPDDRLLALQLLHNSHLNGPLDDSRFGFGRLLVGIGPTIPT